MGGMKLYEYEGKKLFEKYGIAIPRSMVLKTGREKIPAVSAFVLKAQILSGERKRYGGVLFSHAGQDVKKVAARLLGSMLRGEKVGAVLAEERVPAAAEYYVSVSYDTDARAPVLSLSPAGGSEILRAHISPIDMVPGMPHFFIRNALYQARFPREDVPPLVSVIQNLWRLFLAEHALLAEINPLFRTQDGKFIAGDAKIILDDEKLKPTERRFLELGGDIAILASGGGASLVNIDALLHYGGKPANYTEYSGNPPAAVVRDLTVRVLSQKNLKGCWVVGGTANFTDIFETLSGFIAGLRLLPKKPLYPIVIRRDGPRKKEAFEMLANIAKKEGYDFHLFGKETPMSESAKIMVRLAYKK